MTGLVPSVNDIAQLNNPLHTLKPSFFTLQSFFYYLAYLEGKAESKFRFCKIKDAPHSPRRVSQ